MRCAACITLEPLRVDHASEMVEVLGDPALYEFTGGESPTLDELTARYAHQIGGASPDGTRTRSGEPHRTEPKNGVTGSWDQWPPRKPSGMCRPRSGELNGPRISPG